MLDHSQKRDTDSNHASVVIGTLLGTVDSKIIDISNCFPMTLKTVETTKSGEIISQDAPKRDGTRVEYVFDTEYIKKMLAFHKGIND